MGYMGGKGGMGKKGGGENKKKEKKKINVHTKKKLQS